jgi:hypothetical protein
VGSSLALVDDVVSKMLMPDSFSLPSDALSTPEGLAEACEQARRYVENNIPGDHRPGAERYWERFEGRPSGCRCAVGYLMTALMGDLDVPGWLTALFAHGLPKNWNELDDLEAGFDAGFLGHAGSPFDSPWHRAGRGLGARWAQQNEQP